MTDRGNPDLLAIVSPLLVATLLALTFLTVLAVTGRLSFLRDEFRAAWRRVVAAAMLIGIFAVGVFYPLVGGEGGAQAEIEGLSFPELFAGHAVLVVFLVVWWGLQQSRALPEFLALHLEQPLDDLGYGIRIGVAGWLITVAVTMSVAVAAMAAGVLGGKPSAVPPVMVWLAELPVSRKLIIIAVAMTVEEAFFRAFLQRRVGLILSSILFALAHASYGLPVMIISVLTISLLIGRALRLRGRLLPCVVAHGVFDAIQLLIILPLAVRMMS